LLWVYARSTVLGTH